MPETEVKVLSKTIISNYLKQTYYFKLPILGVSVKGDIEIL